MQNSTDWLTQTLSLLLNLPTLLLSSTTSALAPKLFLLLNLLLQSLFFSISILNLLSSLLSMLGLTQASSVLGSRVVYGLIAGVFAWLHVWEFGDRWGYVHEMLGCVSGFYLGLYAVQGCVYVKQRIDPSTQTLTQSPQPHSSLQRTSIQNQLSLITITLLSTTFFLLIWYNIKISKQLPYLANNYVPLAALLVGTVVMYGVCFVRNVSMFLPALACCVLVYLTLVLRIGVDLGLYAQSVQLKNLNFPFEALPTLLLSIQGREHHTKQALQSLHTHSLEHNDHDKQHLQQKQKLQRQLINSTFWAAAGYYLYNVTHGNLVHVQYMVVPGFVGLVLGGFVR